MKTSVYLLAITSIVSSSVFATENIESDDKQLLLASCQALTTTPEQENAKSCFYFIQGFLAAAQTIDPPIINKQEEEKEKRKVFSLMSRPHRPLLKTLPTRLLPFCIPDDGSEARVIHIVAKQLPLQINTEKMLRDEIFKALKTKYPCKKA